MRLLSEQWPAVALVVMGVLSLFEGRRCRRYRRAYEGVHAAVRLHWQRTQLAGAQVATPCPRPDYDEELYAEANGWRITIEGMASN